MRIFAVLVRTEFAGNIGAAARALANMGGERLILIDPRCEVDSQAMQMAAGARDFMKTITVYPGWKEFYSAEGEGIRIALTRRGGRKRRVIALPDQLKEIKSTALEPPGIMYLVFGPEADGLDSADLAYVNFACHLRVFGDFGSLNLAQAVLLALYVARGAFPPESLPAQVSAESDLAVRPFYFPDELIKSWLTAMGFDVQARRCSAYLTLRRLFLQNLPTRHEIQVLEAVLQQNIRKLKKGSLNSLGLCSKELTDNGGDVAGQDIV